MRSTGLRYRIFIVCLLGSGIAASAQDLHFSQYFNAPMLQSPANTALMPESDYRAGINYRTQWGAIPVPFNTFSAYADMQLLRNRNVTNWMGIGVAFFSDRAGDGDLALTKGMVNLAYHVQLDDANMLSVGLCAGYAQRSIDIGKLSFDVQWDGFKFNRDLVNGESSAIAKSAYMDMGAGVNYSYFPNEALYVKFGVGLMHINRPEESLLKNTDNRIGMRPTGMIDALIKLNSGWIANPSVYYTQQKGASEIMFGSQFSCNVSPSEQKPNSLYIGAYYRSGDAIIALAGFEWQQIRVVGTYDITVSGLSTANGGNGAFEVSISYQGIFGANSIDRNAYSCPRF